jgi:uncharacterized protein YaiE (UPF0345 family)
MFKVNEYFDGKVKSIAFKKDSEPATIGVMAPGEYEFGTASQETMKIITGNLTVKLPDQDKWTTFGPGETFIVAANKKFGVIVNEETSYLCLYA